MRLEMACHGLRSGAGACVDVEGSEHLVVEMFGVIGRRRLIDMGKVERLDDRGLAHVAEQRQLAPFLGRDRPVGADQQDMRLDADLAERRHRVLRRLGFQFAGRRDERHQRQMDEDRMVARQVVAELADRLEERQALDVADRAADLAQHEIDVVVAGEHERFDRVGDVRDHLHRAAEIIAAPLLGDDLLIDPAGGDVVHLRRRHAGEALVVAEVEIGLGAVVGDEHFAVLIRAHRARIDVEIGVELPQPHLEAARLEKRAERRRCDAFSEGGNHAAGDEDVPRHGPRSYPLSA